MRLLGRVRLALRRAGCGPWQRDPSTPKEREILVLVLLGHTDVEMARMLSVGPETVKTHTRNVLKKLGAKRRKDVCRNPP